MREDIQFIFLLGGADLEMYTICQLLDSHGVCYYNQGLRWDNACLSAYLEYLDRFGNKSNYQLVGIELQEDVILPDNYISIDHHNQNAGKPSSLEQVAELLGISLTREQQLVAANDKAYIPGMMALQASDDEITEIRRRDRMCQGVTEEDEALAEKAINENMEQVKELIVVKALSPRFSPICDRLFPYRSLLVYTSAEWMYYGEQLHRLLLVFKEDIAAGKLFYGGGTNGYMGSKKNIYTENEIQQIVNRIKTMAENGDL